MTGRVRQLLSQVSCAFRKWRLAVGARKFYRQFVKRGDVCFDIGANVGNRTEVLLSLGAAIIAVEPQSGCAEALRRRFAGNSRVHIVEAAVGAAVGEAEMLIADAHTISSLSTEWVKRVHASRRFGNAAWGQTEMVRMTTLDELIKKHGLPSFCKIDVEGYEPQVLKGLSQPIRCLSFEFTPEYLDAALDCLNRLRALGYKDFNYSLGESLVLGMSDWVGQDEMPDIIEALPKDNVTFGDVYARTQPPEV